MEHHGTPPTKTPKAVKQRLLQHGQLLARAKPPQGASATTLAMAPRCHSLRELRRFHKALKRVVGFGGWLKIIGFLDLRRWFYVGFRKVFDCLKVVNCKVVKVQTSGFGYSFSGMGLKRTPYEL